MTYLATPYSHPDATVMEDRFAQACRIAGAMIGRGEIVYSPIVHGHPISVRCAAARGWSYWRAHCLAMLELASEVVVVQMTGWRTSRGVAAEINAARAFGIPVAFHHADWLLRARAKPQGGISHEAIIPRHQDRASQSLPG